MRSGGRTSCYEWEEGQERERGECKHCKVINGGNKIQLKEKGQQLYERWREYQSCQHVVQ